MPAGRSRRRPGSAAAGGSSPWARRVLFAARWDGPPGSSVPECTDPCRRLEPSSAGAERGHAPRTDSVTGQTSRCVVGGYSRRRGGRCPSRHGPGPSTMSSSRRLMARAGGAGRWRALVARAGGARWWRALGVRAGGAGGRRLGHAFPGWACPVGGGRPVVRARNCRAIRAAASAPEAASGTRATAGRGRVRDPVLVKHQMRA